LSLNANIRILNVLLKGLNSGSPQKAQKAEKARDEKKEGEGKSRAFFWKVLAMDEGSIVTDSPWSDLQFFCKIA